MNRELERKERLSVRHLRMSGIGRCDAGEENDGVADGTRTRDNRNHNPGLYQLSYSHQRNTPHPKVEVRRLCRSPQPAGDSTASGLPDGDRTHNPQLRRLVLYPIELRAGAPPSLNSTGKFGRGERIRTSDILLPKQARYQAASHPGKRAIMPGYVLAGQFDRDGARHRVWV